MTYSVVHFLDDESVEAVPSSWVKNKLCAWPKNKVHVLKYIEIKRVPNEHDFIYFRAREFVRGLKTLNEAKSKANEARYKSDFTDDDDYLLTKSKLNSPTGSMSSMPIYSSPDNSDKEVKKKSPMSQKFESNVTNKNSSKRIPGWSPSPLKNKYLKTHLKQDFAKSPLLSCASKENKEKNKSGKQLAFNNDVSAHSTCSSKTAEKSKTVRQLAFDDDDEFSANSVLSAKTGSDDSVKNMVSSEVKSIFSNRSNSLADVDTTDQCFKTAIQKVDVVHGSSTNMNLQHDKVFENHMLRSSAFFKVELRQIQNNQAVMMEQIESILSHLQNNNNSKYIEKNNLTQNDFQDCPIPLNNETDLNTLEDKIAGDHQFKIRLVNELSYIGGKHVKAMVKRLMAKLFTDDVLSMYSFSGKKGKKPFSALFICSVIFGNYV